MIADDSRAELSLDAESGSNDAPLKIDARRRGMDSRVLYHRDCVETADSATHSNKWVRFLLFLCQVCQRAFEGRELEFVPALECPFWYHALEIQES